MMKGSSYLTASLGKNLDCKRSSYQVKLSRKRTFCHLRKVMVILHVEDMIGTFQFNEEVFFFFFRCSPST